MRRHMMVFKARDGTYVIDLKQDARTKVVLASMAGTGTTRTAFRQFQRQAPATARVGRLNRAP
jgi:hypothetical protein